MIKDKEGIFSFYSRTGLSKDQMAHLAKVMERKVIPSNAMLGGRAATLPLQLEGVGHVVLKTYLRGGLLGKLIKRAYVGHGTPRSGLEMAQLINAARIGVNVPEPVCYITAGGLLYKCWLLMHHVPHECTLASLACADENRALAFMDQVRRQVRLLIDHQIRHVDLHPGNILVGTMGEVYLIDFDKAHQFSGEKHVLACRYSERWTRAVKKYHLPDSLIGQMTSLV